LVQCPAHTINEGIAKIMEKGVIELSKKAVHSHCQRGKNQKFLIGGETIGEGTCRHV
jgi:hypothetical protein